MANITLFSQIISKLDRSKFSKIVAKKETDKHNKGFSSWNHLISMLFCQFAKSQSVRDISNGLRSATGNLNHLGINKAPSKSSISYQNKNRSHELITNQFYWSSNTIAELYKSRWQVEIFFRDIKQLLHIKSFIGTSENAVMIQIWTALITILILKALKAQSKIDWYLSNLVALIRLNLFVKIDLQKWLDKPFEEHTEPPPENIQGVLF